MISVLLRNLVNEVLDNTKESGFDLCELSVEQIAQDLTRHCSGLENLKWTLIIPYVESWLIDNIDYNWRYEID